MRETKKVGKIDRLIDEIDVEIDAACDGCEKETHIIFESDIHEKNKIF